MDDHFHLNLFKGRLSKIERNRPGMEDRFYRENDGADFERLANALWMLVIFPVWGARRLLSLLGEKMHRPSRGQCMKMTPRSVKK